MYTPSQLRALKIAVIAMGAILLLGFATVIGRIVYLFNTAPRPAASVAGPGAGAATSVTALPATAPPIRLPAGAVVRHIALSGNRIAVHFEGPAGAGIHIVDLGGGAGLDVPIVAGAEKRP